MTDPNHLFTLRLKLRTNEPLVVVKAYENGDYRPHSEHTKLDIEVAQGGVTVFERGSLYVGIPAHRCIDGTYAKEAVLSCVAMKPGDTDAEYFDGYTPEQLAWAERNGESINCIAQDRYCDAEGNVK